MADNGKLYPLFDLDFAAQMAKLCAKADIIVPNLTEACFLTGTEYREHYDEQYIETLLDKLAALGTKRGRSDWRSFGTRQDRRRRPGSCKRGRKSGMCTTGFLSVTMEPGIFSQARPSALWRWEKSLQEALEIAADYTVACIRETMEHDAEKEIRREF